MQRKQRLTQPSLLSRAVDSVFRFVRLAEFEILFVLFFVIVYLLFKDLTSRPDYNRILSKKRLDEITSGVY
ncbi:uncharacterized protein [Physcomitrium patens]|uniref:Uncharacterized protein n=1 Tax=Physcomitrium patens TaxID=3218 RepID=A0A2K1JW80_PHYPA|nr:uncharacterized protein LOC112288824 [Physcomitrium patens]PNR45783.1 hypothetical protein PHYPA_015554 [Physcomitrium patens]|eukprot:XP_024389228.1 uncharacterized protein LOC112288824 [Physcomitrella patens]